MNDNKRGGLTNREGLKILVKRFDEFIEKIDSFLPKEKMKISFSAVTKYLSLLYLLIIFALLISYEIVYNTKSPQNWEIIIMIFAIFFFYLSIVIIRCRYHKIKVIQNIRELRKYIVNEISKNDLIISNIDYLENYYSKYEDCFVQTLRDGEWVKIPKNMLVEGDYIKINLGEAACADVTCVDFRYVSISKEKKWNFCLKKNEIFNGFESSLDESNIGPIKSKYDYIFKVKDEWVFEVVNDPFLEILELYVKSYYKNTPSHDIITLNKNKLLIQFYLIYCVLTIVSLYWIVSKLNFWYLCLIIGYPLHLMAALLYFYSNFCKTFLIFWGNAAMKILVKNLKQKKYSYVNKSCTLNNNPLLYKNFSQPFNPLVQNPISSNSGINVQPNQPNVLNTERENINPSLTRSKTFFENEYFLEFSIKEHLRYYMRFLFQGIEQSYNLLYTCSSLNRLCFLDKNGIIFDKEKDVIEVVTCQNSNGVEIINITKDRNTHKEQDYYNLEDIKQLETFMSSLKPIALAANLVQIPQEKDRNDKLIFLERTKVKNLKKIFPIDKMNKYHKTIREKPGFLYSATNDGLKIFFKDCLCLFSKSIGFSDNMINSYKNLRGIWYTNHTIKNIKEDIKREIINNLVDETEESIFYEQGMNENFESEKEAIIVSTLIEDKYLNSQNYFSRGPPDGIINMCQDFWNGKNVEPMNEEVTQKLNSILQQWNSSNIQCVAFSYRPQKKNFSEIINHFDIDNNNILRLFKSSSYPQILLGFIAIKNHLKYSLQDLLDTLKEAGIIFSIFSKENSKITKILGDTLCDYEFNQCISLNKQNETLINQEGNKFLPTGIKEIREFLEKGKLINKMLEDEVPLLVNLFSDAEIKDVSEMIKIYQEHEENVGCVASTLRSDNLFALANTDLNFGIDIRPSFVCNHCLGSRYDFQNKLKPTILEDISMKINSLFFSFVLDETMNYSSIVRIIVLSRYLKKRINLISLFIIKNLFFLILLDLPSFMALSKPILTMDSILYILLFQLPINCISLLCITEKMDYMKIIITSKRMKAKLKDSRNCFIKLLPYMYKFIVYGITILILNIIYFSLLIELNNLFKSKTVNLNKTLLIKYFNSSTFNNLSFYNKNLKAFSDDVMSNITISRSSNNTISIIEFFDVNFTYIDTLFNYFIVCYLFTFVVISSNKRDTLFSCYTIYNYKFYLLSSIPFLIKTFLFIANYLSISNSFRISITYHFLIIIIVWICSIVIIDHFYKLYNKRQFFNKQKNIKLLLETRLGTFSPK